MYTSAPDITNDITVGQVIVQPTATPTATPTSTATSAPSSTTAATATLTPTPTPTYTFPATPPATRRFRQNALTIYGYGPIESLVLLKGFGVSETTTSDKNGFFRFSEIYSYTFTYPELCVQAIDDQKRTTQPSCIPALPNNSLIPLEVGPILLSPTLSLSDNKIVKNQEGYLTGKTTPLTKVNIFIAKGESKRILSLVNTANAYSLPVVNTVSNEKGEFDINMPTSDIAEYKVFASTKFAENLSAKSNTLQFAVISSTKSFWQNVLDFILQNKIILFIIGEVLIFIMLFISALKRTTNNHKRHTERDYLEGIKLN